MRTKKEPSHNINNKSHDNTDPGKNKFRELNDDFDFLDEWDSNGLSEIRDHYSNNFDSNN